MTDPGVTATACGKGWHLSPLAVLAVAVELSFACGTRPPAADGCTGCGDDDAGLDAAASGADERVLNRTHGLTAGAGHTCALARTGRVYCWGSNPDGQLGDGTEIDRALPAPVSGVENAVSVAAGSYHACALLADGTVRCWGWNVAGQVGDGSTINRLTAIAVDGLSGIVAVAAGSYHSCALDAGGQARCWGQNDLGQLGDGSTVNRPRPVTVFSLPPSVAIAASGRHTCALTTDNQVQCWGGNEFGELGDGTTAAHSFPAPAGSLSGVVAVSAGFNHTCVLGTDVAGSTNLESGTARTGNKQVWCWGANDQGQLGDGTDVDSATPVRLDDTMDARSIACGYRHTCLIDAGGRLRCWGWNDGGQLGDGTMVGRKVPVPALLPARRIIDAAGGGFHSCARTDDDQILCWGANESGQLGTAAGPPQPTPVRLANPLD